MKKSCKKYLDEAVKLNANKLIWQQYIFKEVTFDALIRFVFIALALIYSYFNYDKMVKVAKLTADTILNHEVFINPEAYYFVWMLLLAIICFIALILASIALKVLKSSHLKLIYRTYKIYDLIVFIASICVIINFIIMFVITPVTIDGRSMEASFSNEDKVLLWHFGYEPQRDDVIVLDASNYNDPGRFYIKRIVAQPNDNLVYVGTYLYVNGEVVETKLQTNEWITILISLGWDDLTADALVMPNERYIVLGDNRRNSTDSRYFGAIRESDIIGRVILRYYPFNKFGIPAKQILS